MKKSLKLFAILSIVIATVSCSGKSESDNPRTLNKKDQKIESVISQAVFQDLDGNAVCSKPVEVVYRSILPVHTTSKE